MIEGYLQSLEQPFATNYPTMIMGSALSAMLNNAIRWCWVTRQILLKIKCTALEVNYIYKIYIYHIHILSLP